MGKIILLLLFFFLLRFVVRYVWPVVKMARQASRGIRNMQQHMQGGHPQQPYQAPPVQRSRPAKGDYIDFEEVK